MKSLMNCEKYDSRGLDAGMTIFKAMRTLLTLCALISLSFLGANNARAQTNLPLVNISDFEYIGAFRVLAHASGDSNLFTAKGVIGLNPDRNSMYIVGHEHHQAITEVTIPSLVRSTNLESLNMADNFLQPFSSIIPRANTGNPDTIDMINGIKYFRTANGPELMVTAHEWYDGLNDNTDTTLIVRNPNDIANSTINGFYKMDGAAKAAGWITEIPAQWQSLLGGAYISGYASNYSRYGRYSLGPSAYVFDPFEVIGTTRTSGRIGSTPLMVYSVQEPLHEDLSNNSRSNNLWTYESRAFTGFIAPGTRTYVVIGDSGGHNSGVCYKCTVDGAACGGYCSMDSSDYYHYYWLFDVNDLLAAKRGQKAPHEIRPYNWGQFPSAFPTKLISGADYDQTTGRLYIAVDGADNGQNGHRFRFPPLIQAYQINVGSGGAGNIPGSPQRLRVTN